MQRVFTERRATTCVDNRIPLVVRVRTVVEYRTPIHSTRRSSARYTANFTSLELVIKTIITTVTVCNYFHLKGESVYVV